MAVVMTALFVIAGRSAALADIWTYQLIVPPGGGQTSYEPSGKIQAEGGHLAIVCSSHLNVCITYDCNQCHTAASGRSGARPAAFDETRHWREYFPKRAVTVPPGPPLAFGDLLVEQRNGRLIVLDRQRQPLFRLPSGAIVLGDRTRNPAYLVWPGQQPPEALR